MSYFKKNCRFLESESLSSFQSEPDGNRSGSCSTGVPAVPEWLASGVDLLRVSFLLTVGQTRIFLGFPAPVCP